MTARAIFDIYDLNTPFVTPNAPTAPQARTFMQKLAANRVFNAAVVLLVFSAAVYSIGTVLMWFPIGSVLPSQNFGLWLGVVCGGLAAAGAITAILTAAVLRVRA